MGRPRQSTLFARPDALVAGVDEAGRGPLAGPVVAAAVILDPRRHISGLADSKKLAATRRKVLRDEIEAKALSWSVAWCDATEVDALNILHATMLAMRRAVLGLGIAPSYVEVDGNRLPRLHWGGRLLAGDAIVGGDDKVPAISAASILAKVWRDAYMVRLDAVYPGYGFAGHKGYGTEEHRRRIIDLGACPQHRRSFRPVASSLGLHAT